MAADERDLEVTGASVEEAIDQGLAQLGLARGDVIVEVVDEGSGGFLGIGGRDAVVRLKVLGRPRFEEKAPEWERPAPESSEPAVEQETESLAKPTTAAVDSVEAEVALDIMTTLLEKMSVEASVTVKQTEPDDLTGEVRSILDVRGKDMGVLIGPRGETLNALQYVTRLMTGHMLKQRTSFIVDVEGYRARREQALASLANRMAEKAVRAGRPMTLEPMPPNERRIIHLTLRQDERVHTESTGEGRRRKVRIFPD
ncbi:MAG: RNA-binding cell elongation regulator Jag/EloR [Candidatus Promineifilaceae bacterium]|jgi:spoIIIJ-associated protein